MSADAATEQAAKALGTQLFVQSLAAAELMAVYLGVELSLYELLAGRQLTCDELGEEAGIGGRYAREWLEQQAAAGIVTVDASAQPRRYALPEGHRLALADCNSPHYLAPLTVLPVAGIAPALPRLIAAMQARRGLHADDYGDALRTAQDGMNRPVFEHELARWIRTALPDVHEVLRRPGSAIADVGCGTGYSSAVLARSYPAARVRGFDLDPAAIKRAAALVPPGVGERLRFELRDVSVAGAAAGRYDLVCIFDALHDMPQPVRVLGACHAMLKPGGVVLLMEPKAAERFAAPAGDLERFLYAVSVLHCLPVGLSEPASVATGAVMRPETVRRYASAAGFERTTVLDVAHRFHRLYRLDRA